MCSSDLPVALEKKHYGIQGLVRGPFTKVGNVPENSVFSWPNLFMAELFVFVLTVAVILIVIYLLTLVFSLVTHTHLFEPPHLLLDEAEAEAQHQGGLAGLWPWIALLLASTAGLAVQSEVFVSSLEAATSALHLSPLFTGVIVIPIVGGFSEYVPAVRGALRNQMDLPLSLAMGSSLLVALLMAPALVLIAAAIGQPMDLDFTGFEVIALGLEIGRAHV